MWWKIYFWALLILNGLGLIVLYDGIQTISIIDLIIIVDTILITIATGAFVYSKKLLSRSVWKYYFWATLVIGIVGLIVDLVPIGDFISLPTFLLPTYKLEDSSVIYTIFGSLFYIPALYATYKLGYEKK